MKKLLITATFVLSTAFGYSQITNTFPDDGSVGIGTTSPTVKLDVVTLGTRVTYTPVNYAYFGRRNSGVSSGLFIQQQLEAISNFEPIRLISYELGTKYGYIEFNSLSTTNTTRGAITFGSGTTELMRINQNGRVRIASGASDIETPAGYRLFVEDGILTEKVKVALESTADWADYVFAPDYELMPLEEVEAFTKENGHLPNLPSAEEMVANGLDVAQTAKFQQEKIEELTLYLIEMKKQVEALKAEIATLKQQKQ